MTKGWHTETVAVGLIAMILLMAVGATCSFMAGHGINAYIAPASLCLSLAWVLWRSHSLKAAGLLLIIVATSLLAGWYCYDFSYDGNTYHKEIIYNLMHGWNPTDLAQIKAGYAAYWRPWTLHYAKLPELVAACIGKSMWYNIEVGKAFNFMMFATTALMAWSALEGFIASRRARFWTVTAILANPVLIAQIFTYYTDFCTYCYTVISLCVLTAPNISARRYYGIIGAVTLLAIGTKFNAFFYQGVLLTFAILCYMWRREWHRVLRLTALGVAAVIVGVGLLFYHPYITNILWAGHPLYPLLGEGSYDIMNYNTPDAYRSHGRLVNFLYNLIYPYLHPRFAQVHIECRTGGFGAMLLPMLLIAIVAALMGLKRWPAVALYAMAATLLSCLCFDQAWWARYIPQLWLVPCIALVVMEQRREQRWLRRGLVWLAVASLVATLPHLERVRRYHNNMTLERTLLSGSTVRVKYNHFLPGDRYKLDEWCVKCEIVDSLSPDTAIWLFPQGSYIEVTPDTYNALIQATANYESWCDYHPSFIFPYSVDSHIRR